MENYAQNILKDIDELENIKNTENELNEDFDDDDNVRTMRWAKKWDVFCGETLKTPNTQCVSHQAIFFYA